MLNKLKDYGQEIGVAAIAALFTVIVAFKVDIGTAALIGALSVVVMYALAKQKSTKKSVATYTVSNIKTLSFDDVGGGSHVKDELKEALHFLVHKEELAKYGVRQLKGIILTGPPGTGKTLLAKASAHYTDSFFVAASGSEFVEKYVGTGAERIRELFKRAKAGAKASKKDVAIVFIDEIDVIGGKRDGGQMREYDQTLNQLLIEMDGIYDNEDIQVFVIAATNRKDMLDEALLRAGRFDRHIEVGLPDKAARMEILHIHAKQKPVSTDIDWNKLATETYQFSGAQIEAVLNEGAIYAFREQSKLIEMKHLELAIDKVLLGEQINREVNEEDKLRVARHEIGHAIMAEHTAKGSVAQIVLTPRGKAMGYVRHNPAQDKLLLSKSELEHKIMVTLGGAVAEQIFYGERSTGSKGDFEQAINIVNMMIDSGLTEAGIVPISQLAKEQYIQLVNTILDELLHRTEQVLVENKSSFDKILPIMLENEQISGEHFRQILQ